MVYFDPGDAVIYLGVGFLIDSIRGIWSFFGEEIMRSDFEF